MYFIMTLITCIFLITPNGIAILSCLYETKQTTVMASIVHWAVKVKHLPTPPPILNFRVIIRPKFKDQG